MSAPLCCDGRDALLGVGRSVGSGARPRCLGPAAGADHALGVVDRGLAAAPLGVLLVVVVALLGQLGRRMIARILNALLRATRW